MRKHKVIKRSAASVAVLLCSIITVLAISVGAGIAVYRTVADSNAEKTAKGKPGGSAASAVYPAGDGSGSAVSGDQAASSAVMASLESKMAAVTDKVSASASFQTGNKGTKGTWMLGNPAGNHVLMQAQLVDTDGQTIATSVVIRPGQHLESLTLSRSVTAGSRTVTAYLSYFDPDTQTLIGKAAYQIRLAVG